MSERNVQDSSYLLITSVFYVITTRLSKNGHVIQFAEQMTALF